MFNCVFHNPDREQQLLLAQNNHSFKCTVMRSQVMPKNPLTDTKTTWGVKQTLSPDPGNKATNHKSQTLSVTGKQPIVTSKTPTTTSNAPKATLVDEYIDFIEDQDF
jgi:hypothetical protein